MGYNIHIRKNNRRFYSDIFNYVKIAGRNEQLRIRLDELIYSNDIIEKYNSDVCMSSESKIIFYNNKKIVGCGIFA